MCEVEGAAETDIVHLDFGTAFDKVFHHVLTEAVDCWLVWLMDCSDSGQRALNAGLTRRSLSS